MKANELIALLSQCPPNASVILSINHQVHVENAAFWIKLDTRISGVSYKPTVPTFGIIEIESKGTKA